MILEVAIALPMAGLASMLARAGRQDPDRRARKEAAWRDLIQAAACASNEVRSGSENIFAPCAIAVCLPAIGREASMSGWNFFTGASERWRADARIRVRRVIAEHGEDPSGYVQKRIDRTRFGTFERRRWTYIRKLLPKGSPNAASQFEPLSTA